MEYQKEIKEFFNNEFDKDNKIGRYEVINGRPQWLRSKMAQNYHWKKVEEERKWNLSHVCQDCHMVLPHSLICDWCGKDYN